MNGSARPSGRTKARVAPVRRDARTRGRGTPVRHRPRRLPEWDEVSPTMAAMRLLDEHFDDDDGLAEVLRLMAGSRDGDWD